MALTIWPRVKIATSDVGFTLDTDVLDGAATLQVNPLVQIPDADIRSLSVRRGGRRWSYDTGECVIVLDNRGGNYDPAVLSGDYGDRIKPGMQVQVLARVADYYEPTIYTGKLVEVRTNPDPFLPTVTWLLEDALAELGQLPVTAPAGAVDVLEAIAFDMMEEAHQDTSGVPSIDGRTVRRPTGLTYREAFNRFAVSEAGRFFVGRDNVPYLRLRADEVGMSESLTLNAEQVSPWYGSVTLSPGFGQVVNEVTVKRDDTDDVTADNGDSVSMFGRKQLSVTAALSDDDDAVELAQFLADYYSQPARLVETVTCNPTGWDGYDPVTGCLLEIGDLVAVVLPDGDTARGTVERIEWDFGDTVTLRLGLDRYDAAGYGNASWFVLDTSALDGTSLLAAF